MRPPSIASALVVSWIMAEVITYVMFFSNYSIVAGLLVGVGSIALGALVLRRLGKQMVRLAAADLKRRDVGETLRLAPLAAIGAVLLVAPGFLSDAVGLVLVIAGGRVLFAPAPQRPRRDIDLDPGEWRRAPDDPRSH